VTRAQLYKLPGLHPRQAMLGKADGVDDLFESLRAIGVGRNFEKVVTTAAFYIKCQDCIIGLSQASSSL
jgi:hypothetical protein